MSKAVDSDRVSMKALATVERVSDRELVVTRSFDAPARLVFAAWTHADLFRQWWVPRSYGLTLLSCAMDVRVGGSYRLEFAHPADSAQVMAFFGRYTEVVPDARIVWTNEESPDGAVTTVTFEERGGQTLLTVRDRYPSKEALDKEVGSGATGGLPEALDQLDAFLAAAAR